jgi:predicted nucleic acid-binding protein
MNFPNIFDIRNCTPQNKKYFLDANVWLLILNRPFNPKPNEKAYLDFVTKITGSIFSPRPKIIMTSLLLSEVINRHLRSFAMPEFAKNNHIINPSNNYYKEVYRQSSQFKIDQELLCDDIKGWHNYIELVDDEFNALRPFQLLKNFPANMDFNDNYYYSLCKKNSYSIVTNDGDFLLKDIEVITANKKDLLDKRI